MIREASLRKWIWARARKVDRLSRPRKEHIQQTWKEGVWYIQKADIRTKNMRVIPEEAKMGM